MCNLVGDVGARSMWVAVTSRCVWPVRHVALEFLVVGRSSAGIAMQQLEFRSFTHVAGFGGGFLFLVAGLLGVASASISLASAT